MIYAVGFDIGGTKCAVSLGEVDGGNIRVIERQETPTLSNPKETLSVLAPFLKKWDTSLFLLHKRIAMISFSKFP